jgi:hypothetical protein
MLDAAVGAVRDIGGHENGQPGRVHRERHLLSTTGFHVADQG